MKYRIENGKIRGASMRACAQEYAGRLEELRLVARTCGYALGLHGSMTRDLDLLVVPWVKSAVGAEAVVEAIRSCVKGRVILPYSHEGSHGKSRYLVAYGDGFYLDLAVLPVEGDGRGKG